MTLFSDLPIGRQFIEAFTPCDELATKITPTTHDGKTVTARRSGGKLIYMADWEPVLLPPPLLSNFWQCLNCGEHVHEAWDHCLYCEVK